MLVYKLCDLGGQWRSVLGNMVKLCLSSTALATGCIDQLWKSGPARRLCWLPRGWDEEDWTRRQYSLLLGEALVGWNRRCAASMEGMWWAGPDSRTLKMPHSHPQQQPVLLVPVQATAGPPSFVPLSRVLSSPPPPPPCSHNFCVKS